MRRFAKPLRGQPFEGSNPSLSATSFWLRHAKSRTPPQLCFGGVLLVQVVENGVALLDSVGMIR